MTSTIEATVAQYPLGDCLCPWRDFCRVAEERYQQALLSSADNAIDCHSGPRMVTLLLIESLMKTKVASSLTIMTDGPTIADILANIVQRIMQEDRYDYEDYRPLSQCVIEQGTDIEIWTAIYDLISIVDDNERSCRRELESAMFRQIKKCTYRHVGGFFGKYFENKPWSSQTKAIYGGMKDQHKDGRWIDFPDPPDEHRVWDWLSRLQVKYLQNSPGVMLKAKGYRDLIGRDTWRPLDVIMERRGLEDKQAVDWRTVQVIGVLKQWAQASLTQILTHLTILVRKVFMYQPTRRFIHGFFLHGGTTLELWVWDRSGPYSSGEFDIHENPKKFIGAIAGYGLMDNEELGMDTFTEVDGSNRFISIPKEATGEVEKIQLARKPFIWRDAVVSRGTTCYLGSDQDTVVKLAWRCDKRLPESNLLRLAEERNVEGIPKVMGWKVITSIVDLRSGLSFSSHHVMPELKGYTSESSSSSEGLSPAPPQRLYDNRILECLVITPVGQSLGDFCKSPVATRPIPVSINMMLIALRDAIKAHRSLFLKGKILHRDISDNNIIITKTENPNDCMGILIDLDHAISVDDDEHSSATHRIGTLNFMAIEVLLGIENTYRHDLESFFYVLIWLCARRGWDLCGKAKDRPQDSKLERWYRGTFKIIADTKLFHMTVYGLEGILKEFPNDFDHMKPLCVELRDIIFPLERNGKPFTGTPPYPAEELYDAVLLAFERALTNCYSCMPDPRLPQGN